MDNGISAPGTPAKTFQTPNRPLSQQQFQSLREKAIKQSPALYKHKVLSDPTSKTDVSKSGSSSVFAASAFSGRFDAKPSASTNTHTASPVFRGKSNQAYSTQQDTAPVTNSDLLPDEPVGQKQQTDLNFSEDSAYDKLTDFENPALAAFTSRMVNKELEMRRLLTNVVLAMIWNLIYKFVSLFFQFTKRGSQLRDELYLFVLKNVVYKINPHANINSFWFQMLSWQFATSIFHTIVIFNIASCLWNLLIKAQNTDISDLHLTENQKRLLGVVESTPDYGRSFDPSINIGNSKVKSLNEAESKSSHKPFIFKSLQTPMKMRELNTLQQAEVKKNHVSFSLQPKKVNAFGVDHITNVSNTPTTLFTSTRSQPDTRPGYIPSNRYTYMMDSPSAMKKR